MALMTKTHISINDETLKQLREESIRKYGKLRSVSRLIEDMVKEGIRSADTIEAIKAERLEWIVEMVRDQLSKVGTKGPICAPETFWICPVCDAEFQVIVRSDAKRCPACGCSDVKPTTEPKIGHRIASMIETSIT